MSAILEQSKAIAAAFGTPRQEVKPLTGIPTKSWDSIARAYVERTPVEDVAVESFGVLCPRTGDGVPGVLAHESAGGYAKWMGKPGEFQKSGWEGRKGDWMQTFTGRQFWPLDPRADEIYIEDIAHSLSLQCRYAGHCLRFYSVAEHSVKLSFAVAPENSLWALLHDASEAYLVDLPRPVKPFLVGYKPAEAIVQRAVCERFGLPIDMPAEVHQADGRILADESAQNMAPPPKPWNYNGEPLGVVLDYWSPESAERMFLARFHALQNMRVAA